MASPPSPRRAFHRRDGQASRARIRDIVGDNPGIHVSELAERVALSWHATAYHLDILRRMGKVSVEKSGRERFVFARDVPAAQRWWFVAIRDTAARKVILRLFEHPGQNVPSLSRALGCSTRVVRRRLEALVKIGFVESRGTWRPVFSLSRSHAPQLAALISATAWSRPPPRVGSWEWDLQSGRSNLSPEGLRICGLQPGPPAPELLGRWFMDLVHPDDRATVEAVLAAALGEGRPYDQIVLLRTPRGGRLVRSRGRVMARDAKGTVTRLGGTLEEIWPSPASAPSEAMVGST